jgi:hypothetical protein
MKMILSTPSTSSSGVSVASASSASSGSKKSIRIGRSVRRQNSRSGTHQRFTSAYATRATWTVAEPHSSTKRGALQALFAFFRKFVASTMRSLAKLSVLAAALADTPAKPHQDDGPCTSCGV